MRKILFPMLALGLLSACGSTPRPEPSAELAVVEDAFLPVPARSDLTTPGRQALIGPLDTIGIDVYGVEELSMQFQVDASGEILMPLIRDVQVGGRTPSEVAQTIEGRLTQYIRDPSVSVNITKSVSQVVTVDGEVNEPGQYPVTNRTTLMSTIASARGLSEFAKLEDVVILRTVGGQRYAGLYNLGAIRLGAYADPEIYANDTIIVGDSPTRRIIQDFGPLAPLITTPLIVLLQNGA